MLRGAAVLLAAPPSSAVLLGYEIVLFFNNKIDQQASLGSHHRLAAYAT